MTFQAHPSRARTPKLGKIRGRILSICFGSVRFIWCIQTVQTFLDGPENAKKKKKTSLSEIFRKKSDSKVNKNSKSVKYGCSYQNKNRLGHVSYQNKVLCNTEITCLSGHVLSNTGYNNAWVITYRYAVTF